MSRMEQMMTTALAAEPGLLDRLDRLHGDTRKSPLIRLMCKGRGRATARHETGAALRFKRSRSGWTLTAGRDSVAGPGVDTDGRISVTVRCAQCAESTTRAGRNALVPMMEALEAREERRVELAEQGVVDAGPVRVSWR